MPELRLCSIVLGCALFGTQSLEALNLHGQASPGSQEQINRADTPRSPNMAPSRPQAIPSTHTPESSNRPKDEAWQTLEASCRGNKVDRANATLVLGFLHNDSRARNLAEKALSDPKAEVRSAGAAALGEMGSRKSIPKLKKARAIKIHQLR